MSFQMRVCNFCQSEIFCVIFPYLAQKQATITLGNFPRVRMMLVQLRGLPLKAIALSRCLCSSVIGVCLTMAPAIAQITSDNTTGTIVTGSPNVTITGGSRAGGNLFHSFSQFSVPTGGAAIFNNALDVQNILSRVTGGTVSNIDGLIQANGTANVFLLNPSGMIFGANARLAIGGSFLGTTASSIRFADGTEFSASNATLPLLTVSAPIGLNFGANAGAIALQGAQLAVPTGNTLALVGGAVTLSDGSLSSPSGRIEIGSVGGTAPSLVSLAAQGFLWSLGYAQGQVFQTVQMSNQSLDTSGTGGGSIQVVGDRVNLINGTRLTADTLGDQAGQGVLIQARQFLLDHSLISSSSFGDGAGGNLTINASETINLKGSNDLLEVVQQIYAGIYQPASAKDGLFTANFGSAQGGSVQLNTLRLTVENGAGVLTSTFASGGGGSLAISSAEGVAVNRGFLVAGTVGDGNAGNLKIQTRQLVVENLGDIETSTLARGRAGDLWVDANDIQVLGSASSTDLLLTGLFASSETTGTMWKTGDAGNVRLNTDRLLMTAGANIGSGIYGDGQREGQTGGSITINASQLVELVGVSPDAFQFPTVIYTDTTGVGSAGQLVVNTRQLILRDGALISAGTLRSGQGGSMTINATDSIMMLGSSPSTEKGLDNGYYAFNNRFPSGLITSSRGTGNAGDLAIATGRLTMQDGAVIAVNGQETGNAGNLSITASQITLRNHASILAGTASGEGGNIDLQVKELLLLRHGSQITATAGGSGNGGNITITAPFIVAVSGENSDIIANAVKGRGGNIQITTQGIFGLKFRPFLTPLSDITASSQFGVSGSVTIITPNVNPTATVRELSTELVDANQQIVSECEAYRGSRFVVTGRGGIPEDPTDYLSGTNYWTDVRDVAAVSPQGSGTTLRPLENPAPPLLEATGWRRTATGEMELYATNAPGVQGMGHASRCFRSGSIRRH